MIVDLWLFFQPFPTYHKFAADIFENMYTTTWKLYKWKFNNCQELKTLLQKSSVAEAPESVYMGKG